jgi:uncharacterized damage-inducible protein DinB
MPPDTATIALDALRTYLSREYLPRLRGSLVPLSTDDIWWRPTPESNSIGNLLLHLVGNARQWISAGVGGRPDARNRDAEFADPVARWDTATFDTFLVEAFTEFDAVLHGVDPATLHDRRRIQGADVSVFDAILHVVEHISMHTGQVIQLAKWRAPGQIAFYEATSAGFRRLY